MLYNPKFNLYLLCAFLLPSTQFLIGCKTCPEGQECAPKPTSSTEASTTLPAAGSGGAGGASGSGSGGSVSLNPDSALTTTPCIANACTAVGGAPACAAWGGCDLTTHMCKIVQGSAGAGQCMDGDKRHCSTPTVSQGVYYCDTSICDYKTTDCLPCGKCGQACCVGGCEQNLKCSQIANARGSVCQGNGGSGGNGCVP